MRKGIIRTILDDHRDVVMYRHAFMSAYLELTGKSQGATARYDIDDDMVRCVFRKIRNLVAMNNELKAIVREYEKLGGLTDEFNIGNGRSPELIKRRDEKLCKRYAYYIEWKHLSQEEALRVLADQEFFISQEQIIEILNKQCL